MRLRDCLERLAPHAESAVVVCALGMAANEWWEVTRSEETFYMHGAMGFASSFALGLALAMLKTPVWIVDGDGSLCMNVGTLLTAGALAPPNLKHLVVVNNVYQTVGGVPMVGAERSDYAMIARGAGLERAAHVSSLDDLPGIVPWLGEAGHCFIALHVEPDDRPITAPPQPFEGPEMKYRFGRAMERRFGLTVFGPEGY